MSAMQAEVFEAFRAIDVPEDKALRAAAALTADVAAMRREIASLKGTIVALETHIDRLTIEMHTAKPQLTEAKTGVAAASTDIMALRIDAARMQGELALPKWMMGLVIGSLIAYSLSMILR